MSRCVCVLWLRRKCKSHVFLKDPRSKPTYQSASVPSVWGPACLSWARDQGCLHHAAGWACWASPEEIELVGWSPDLVLPGSHWWWFAGGQAGYLMSINIQLNFSFTGTMQFTTQWSSVIIYLFIYVTSFFYSGFPHSYGRSILFCDILTICIPHTMIFVFKIKYKRGKGKLV